MTDASADTPDGGRGAPTGLLPRLGWRVLRLLRVVRRRPSPRLERALLVVSLLAFVGAAVAAYLGFPDVGEVRWGLLLLAGMVGMPLNIAINAVEFQVIGRFVDQRVAFTRATKVTVVGSAANLLPIPGSTLVRIQALVADAATYRDAIAASVAVGVLSVGANLGLAGLAQVGAVSPLAVTALLAAAGVVTAVAIGMIRVTFPGGASTRLSGYALALELGYASVASVRLWLILLGLGLDVGLPAAFALTATGSLATAVGFFPAGLGIREVLVGVVSPLVGVPLAAGLAGAVGERLFWFVVLAVASLVLLARDGRRAFASTSPSAGSPAPTPNTSGPSDPPSRPPEAPS